MYSLISVSIEKMNVNSKAWWGIKIILANLNFYMKKKETKFTVTALPSYKVF